MSLQNQHGSKWKDEFIITAYELAREGTTEFNIARVLGISKPSFVLWEKNKPLFKMAITRGRMFHKHGTTPYCDMMDYIYRKLPEDLKELWQKLHQFNLANDGIDKVEALFAGKGRIVRQKMYITALVKCNFNVAAACRMTGLARDRVEKWKRDFEFQRLIKEVGEIEKDWAESCLRRLVQAGDATATIHLNRCRNADRGLNEKTQIDVNVHGQINHNHKIIAIETLDLPISIQKMILEKVREQRKLVDSREVATQQLNRELVASA
jgi:DNA-binding XRE family transcriptional regulator